MGRTYLFECSKCSYRAKVSGGADEGAHFTIQTISCADCRELYDAVMSMKVPVTPPVVRWKLQTNRLDVPKVPVKPPKFQVMLDRLPPVGGKRYRWLRFKATCPTTARHRVKEWKSPGPCPRCGYFMEANALPFRRWD